MSQTARSGLLLLVALAAVGLVAAAGTPAGAFAELRDAGSASDPFAPLVAAVALLAQLLAGYLVVVSALALAAGVPGRLGRTARTVAARLTPALLRRVLGIALGVSTAVAVVGVSPAAAAGPGSPRAGASVPALDWPTAAAPTAPTSAPSPAALDWPAPAAAPAAASAAPPVTSPPRTLAQPRTAPGVTVAAGDTLWGIAARHLPADAADATIARAWPTWWAANRDAVGADPDLITPGTHLAPPAPPTR